MFQVRGKKILAEEPQPPGAGWAGKVPGTGTSSLSTGLWGGARPPLGSSGTAPSPTCLHATVRKKSRMASGRARLSPCPPARLRGAGWPLTSSPSGLLGHAGAPARTCKHPRARSRALQPQPEPFDSPPYRPHRAEPARPGMFAPRLGADLRPQVPRSPAPGCQQFLRSRFPDKPHAARQHKQRAPDPQQAGASWARSGEAPAAPTHICEAARCPTSERLPPRRALKFGSSPKPRALRSECARAKAFGTGPRHPARPRAPQPAAGSPCRPRPGAEPVLPVLARPLGHSPQVAVLPVRGPAGVGAAGTGAAWVGERRARVSARLWRVLLGTPKKKHQREMKQKS